MALLLLRAAEQGVRIFFKRVENKEVFDKLAWYCQALAQSTLAQGYLWDVPAARLPDTLLGLKDAA